MIIDNKHECQDCLHVGPLNTHGCCERCGSSAVVDMRVLAEEGEM